MNGFLSENTLTTLVKSYQSANTTAVNSDGVDMQGYDGVLFVVALGTAAANNTVNAAQGADNSADWTDLEGTSVASGSNKLVLLDVGKPTDRYIRCEVARGTSTTVDAIIAIRYRARTLPVDNTDGASVEQHFQPDEGTA
ncbi:MAG TPA: hypothetical protein P5572_07230 [Phycisphaerae bacterium]|nr:hypothetical protein [Phycisphaerae bacterium]